MVLVDLLVVPELLDALLDQGLVVAVAAQGGEGVLHPGDVVDPGTQGVGGVGARADGALEVAEKRH